MSERVIPTSLLGLTTERHGPSLVVTVRGEIDLSTRQQLERHLEEALHTVSPPHPLVVDLSEVSFLGSSGLALLLNTQKVAARRGTPLRVVATQRVVRRPVEAVGLSDALPLHGTVPAALHGVPAPRTGEEVLEFDLAPEHVPR
ncbi:STAS domain-containing protein [Saccharomonospora saliphila]|uniref:STAS domain-containing protein n=1 Tax=Saccharomonospora saliphila TaxID=369829 RepID=UPI000A003349|nr:STAS domain-containing protein [Saccharomonospora saliphila]